MNRESLFWQVAKEERLLPFVKGQLPSTSSNRAIKRAIEGGLCFVNRRVERFASKQLKRGDMVEFHKKWEEKLPDNRLPPVSILFEDEYYLILNKPSNLISQVQEVSDFIGKKVRLGHRLDRGTSGAFICCKTDKAFQGIYDLFAEKKVLKTYLALVKGSVNKKREVVTSYLGIKKKYQGQSIWGSVASQGLFAHTEWDTLAVEEKISLLSLIPHTGRTHQLRVHTSERGYPIWGDLQYDRRVASYCPRLMLHSSFLSFSHPLTGKKVEVQAPVPEEMSLFAASLGLDNLLYDQNSLG